MELAARKRGLEHVAGIHRAIARRTCTHDGMEFVDEQDDLTVGILDLAQHRLQAVLELAAVLCTGDHGGQIEHDDIAILQRRGYVARDDALRQTLDDRGLARAGLADEHRVVLRTARQHLDGATDLVGTADDRVELAFARHLRKVLAVLLKRLELGLGGLIGHARIAAQLFVCGFDVLARHACHRENFARRALVFGKRNEQVLACSVAVAELFGDLHGTVDQIHEIGAGNAAHHHRVVAAHLRHALDLRIDVCEQLERLGTDALDDGRKVVLFRFEQSFQHVNRLCLRSF